MSMKFIIKYIKYFKEINDNYYIIPTNLLMNSNLPKSIVRLINIILNVVQ